MKYLVLTYTILFFFTSFTIVGCGAANTATDTTTPNSSNSSSGDSSGAVSGSGSGSSSIVSITFYQKTATNGSGSIGSCTQYNSKTYCWDDGLHGAQSNWSYWNVVSGNSGCRWTGGGGLPNLPDCMTAPTIVTAGMLSYTGLTQALVNQVLNNTGSAITISCTLDGSGNVDCPSFTIDVGQTPL